MLGFPYCSNLNEQSHPVTFPSSAFPSFDILLRESFVHKLGLQGGNFAPHFKPIKIAKPEVRCWSRALGVLDSGGLG